ncbi:phosphomannomutase CpsG [Lentisphaera marina]|uniref:phosphomannomutase CpsG n=1 Tax=Lentisphaera marina TaxID=1111041 RepID=UPI0023663DA0|nr:phosphomannomutase CpsG [Lentisphaera marina]MDD7983660.1 phosphomannomutase CpsG [Lentisphaera marina]
MKISLNGFTPYDLRAKLGEQLNSDIAYAMGRAFALTQKAKRVCVGGDIRLSSEELKNSLARGLADAGCEVIDLGLTGTEEVYFATVHFKLDGGIQVTASHNPKDYNGMKFVGPNAIPIGMQNGLQDIKKSAEQFLNQDDEESPNITSASIIKSSCFEAYISHILNFIDLAKLRPMRLLMNAGNGTAGHIIDAIENEFKKHHIPIEFIKINNDPNGKFPKGIPNPLLHSCRAETAQAVLDNNCDLGIAWDGDCDRCFFFDNKGDFIEGYFIVGFLAEAFLKHDPNQIILQDPRLTWNTIDIVKEAGGQCFKSKTGHAFIKKDMRERDAVYGGEMSAHHYFRDFFYCDSGMIPWLLVIELLSSKQADLHELLYKRIEMFPNPGELNYTINQKDAAIKAIEKYFREAELKPLAIEYFDGLNIEFDDWRFSLRRSNTEPLVRLNIETRADKELLKNKLRLLNSLLDKWLDS